MWANVWCIGVNAELFFLFFYYTIFIDDSVTYFFCRCDPNEESLSYEDVKSRIMELINYDSLLAVATKKAIIRLTECTLAVPNVWTDLMEDLEISGVG